MLAILALLAGVYAHPEQLVDTDWVAAHAADANVRVVDMRQAGYPEGHVPGSVYLSPVAIRDAKAPPTFLPTPQAFANHDGEARDRDSTRVVVYDERGGVYAARLWWILNYFGHTNVALMNGGWIKWTAEQRPTATDAPTPLGGKVHAAAAARDGSRLPQTWSRAINKPDITIVDARTTAEIEGKDLRNIKRGGFVASSVPVYWEELLDPQSKTFKPADELRKIYRGPRHRAVAGGDRVLPGRDARVGRSVRAAPDWLRRSSATTTAPGRSGETATTCRLR